MSKNMKTLLFAQHTQLGGIVSRHKAAFEYAHGAAGLFYWPLNMKYMWFSYP